MKKLFSIMIAIALLLGILLTSCAQPAQSVTSQQTSTTQGSTTATQKPTETKKFVIALSNSFVGNDWRQFMQKIAQMVAENDLYKDRVELKIVNCENSAEAQAASIDALIMEKVDAILVDGSSPTGLNPAIERASSAGIVVVSFDQLVTAPSAWKLTVDYGLAAEYQAKYLAEAINGKGKVVVDRGLPGAQGSGPLYERAKAVFAQYPDIEIVAEFDGKFAEAETLAGMSSAIAANPQIDAVYTQGYILPVVKALQEAKRPLVPISGWSYNSSFLALAQNNCDGVITHGTPGIGAEAMKMALDILEGKSNPSKEIVYRPLLVYAMNPDTVDLGTPVNKVELGKNALEGFPPGFQIPDLADDVGVKITPEEMLAAMKN